MTSVSTLSESEEYVDVNIPTALEYITSYSTGSCCYSASYKCNGDILLGTAAGLNVLNRESGKILRYDTQHERVTSFQATPKNNFILHRKGNTCKIDICLADNVKMSHTLFEFDRLSTFAAHLGFSDKNIVVKHPDTTKIIIYNFETKLTQTIRPEIELLKVHLLPDDDLLATTKFEDSLIRYGRRDKGVKEIWRCDGLTNSNSICSDASGLLYTRTDHGQTIHVISPGGK